MTNKTDLSNEQMASILDAKKVLADKEQVLKEIGQIEAFDFINKLATVATLKTLAKIKESKAYVGLTYFNENKELATVANWEQFCTHKLNTPKRTIDDRLLNLSAFGEEFFEASKSLGLGSRDLRKLRQFDEEDQITVINSEAVNLEDGEAVKELIEDLNEKHNQEKADLTQKLTESTQIANARKKLVETNAALLEDQIKKNDILEANQKAPKTDWAKVVHEINLECTKLAALAIEQMDKLMALNERIIAEEIDPEHSQTAYEHMARVQVHVVDQVFVVANTLSIESRERFEMFVSAARPMYSEDEILAIEQQVKNRG
jgi:hypothetical protein